MGWRRIGNGLYYYRSRRQGGRGVSEYVGRGEVASLMAQLVDLGRQEREGRRAENNARRDAAEREARRFADWFRAVEDVANGAMLAAGFHKHRGQWRRRRHGEDERGEGDGCPRGEGAQRPGKADV